MEQNLNGRAGLASGSGAARSSPPCDEGNFDAANCLASAARLLRSALLLHFAFTAAPFVADAEEGNKSCVVNTRKQTQKPVSGSENHNGRNKPRIDQLVILRALERSFSSPRPLSPSFFWVSKPRKDMEYCAGFSLHLGARRLKTVQPPSPTLAAQPPICPSITTQQAVLFTFLRHFRVTSNPLPPPGKY